MSLLSAACHLGYPVTESWVPAGMAPPDVLCSRPSGAVAVVAFALLPFLCVALAALAVFWATSPIRGGHR
jgi:hypothetical protein